MAFWFDLVTKHTLSSADIGPRAARHVHRDDDAECVPDASADGLSLADTNGSGCVPTGTGNTGRGLHRAVLDEDSDPANPDQPVSGEGQGNPRG